MEGVDDALARLGRRHQQRATVELGQALRLLVVNLAGDWVVIELACLGLLFQFGYVNTSM